MRAQLGGQLDPPRRVRRAPGLGVVFSAQQSAQIAGLATQAGVDPTTAANAVAMINYDAPLITNALHTLQTGSPSAAMQAAIPIIAGAVALVNPVAGAAVAGTLTVFATVFQWLGQVLGIGGGGSNETCNWKFPPTGAESPGTCFYTNQRPYGPADRLWLPLSTFATAPMPNNQMIPTFCGPGGCGNGGVPGGGTAYWAWVDIWGGAASGNRNSWLDDINTASPMPNGFRVMEMAGAELSALGDTGVLGSWWNREAVNTNHTPGPSGIPNWRMQTPGMKAFALVYARAFQHALEYPLNGYKMYGGGQLLQFLAQVWNNRYTGNPAYSVGAPPQFQAPPAGYVAIDGTGFSLADMAVAGFIDQWATQSATSLNSPAIYIYDPPVSALVNPSSGAPTVAAPSKVSPGVVTAGIAGAGLATVGGVAVATGQSAGAVLSGALVGVKALLGLARWPL